MLNVEVPADSHPAPTSMPQLCGATDTRRNGHTPMFKPESRNARHIAGRLRYREERYVFFGLWEETGGTQTPRGDVNRVAAASVANAAPMPVKKLAEAHSPVESPIARPPITATVASA